MGNNFSKPVRHNVRKQGQKPRQHGTVQSSQKLSREQLIHRLETLRERREELDNQQPSEIIEKQKEKILIEYNQYLEQLKRFD
jgi:hypothetical protein